LIDENKYLSRILKKGIHGKFSAISKWLKLVEGSLSVLINILKVDERSISIILKTLTSGILSKNDDINRDTKKIISELIKILLNDGYQSHLWNWLCQENGGLATFLIALKKNQDNIPFIFDSLFPIAKSNFMNFFNIELRKIISDHNQFVSFIHNFLHLFSKHESYEKEVYKKVFFFNKKIFYK
jgi:hypothetical protein